MTVPPNPVTSDIVDLGDFLKAASFQAAPSPLPSPSPTTVATQTPTPTPSPVPSPTSSVTPAATVPPVATASPTPTPSPSPTPTPAPAPQPSPAVTPSPSPTPSVTPTLTPSPAPAVSPTPVATSSATPSPTAIVTSSATVLAATPTPASTTQDSKTEIVTAIVTADKEAVLSSGDGRVSLKMPAGSFSEEVRVEMKIIPPPPSTGMRMIRLLELNAYATRRSNAAVTSLARDAAITIVNTDRELRGLNRQSLKLYYLDPADRKWKPASSRFDASAMTLTAATNHFSYYGEMADPVVSGPATIMAFEAHSHSGTVKAGYPIELQPSPGGFKPKLQLTYDSGRADGMKNKRSLGSWVGTGWSLHPGAIIYDEESNEYTMEIGGVGYEVFRSGDKYFTKPDMFYKITRDEANQKWEVWDRGGTYYRFGGTTDSSQYYQKDTEPPQTVYHRWDLNWIKDTHNNQAVITYIQNTVNNSVRSAYPDQMYYGNNVIVFNSSYNEMHPSDGEVRRDSPVSVSGGVPAPKVMETRRLDSIEVKVIVNYAATLARKYSFAYATTDRVSSTDYGGIYYSGSHTLTSITQVGADGASTLPAMTFSYSDLENFYLDGDGPRYTGNPGNPASLSWPRLTYLSNGYGAAATFGYTRLPAVLTNDVWTRHAVTSRTINPGIGPSQSYSYVYDGNPEYLGNRMTARYRGFRKVKETDAAGNYTWRYFHTTGYDDAGGKDWEKVTGREYKVQHYDSGNNLLQETVNTWNWQTSWFWDPFKPEYAFLTKWDGYDSNDGNFNDPGGIAVDAGGNVYVADMGNARIQKFTGAGSYITRWNGGWLTGGVAAAGNGNIYVRRAHNVDKYDSNGVFLSTWQDEGYYGGIAVSPADNTIYTVSTTQDDVGSYAWVRRYNIFGVLLNSWGGSEGSGDGQFYSPQGIAVDAGGYVYVADTGNHRIQKFSATGTFLGKFGSYGAGNDQFINPSGVAVDGSGYVYVADTGNHRVKKFQLTLDGNGFITGAQAVYLWGKTDNTPGTGDGEFSSPKGVAASGGYIFVSDSGNNRVQKLPAGGGFTGKWGAYGSGSGQFSAVEDVAHYNNSLTWTVSSAAHEVKRFDASGKYLGKFGSQGSANGQFSSPKGIGVGVETGAPYVYVADTGNHRLQKFSSTGTHVTTVGGPVSGNAPGYFDSPQDVAVTWDGAFFYVADTGNNRIQKFTSAGVFQTQWNVNNPVGVAVDGLGQVYVADSGNSLIKMFDSSGQSQGQFGGPGSGDGQFSALGKIAADDSAPSVFVVDTGNHRIQKFDHEGLFLTKFGLQGGDHGAFQSPRGVAVSSEGDFIYVADTGNNRVQKITYHWYLRLDQTDVTRGNSTRKTTYDHDGKGNVRAVYNYGDPAPGVTEDDSSIHRLFSNNQTAWILDKIQRERTYSGITSDTGAGYKLETRYFYDLNPNYTDQPVKGDLTKLEKYDPATQAAINWQKSFDSYGNVTAHTDANGKTTNYTYDLTYHTFVTKKEFPSVAGAQRMEENYTWNYTGGRMTSEIDANGQTTSYEYDSFWRPVKLIRPGDSSASPTIEHAYQSWGTVGQQHIYTTQKIDGSNNLWSRRYFDGIARIIQSHGKGETGRTIVTTTTFNNRGLTDREYVAQDLGAVSGYQAPQAGWKYSAYTYDGLKRVLTAARPDATTVSHLYQDWQDTVTNERGKKKRYYNDAFGRLIKVE
ncbi:MAG: hypothetical protein HY673_01795, partial [Chloroflexi bacterium]|nr:hypothetical protein [Chloroflexota bacterium]